MENEISQGVHVLRLCAGHKVCVRMVPWEKGDSCERQLGILQGCFVFSFGRNGKMMLM